MGYSCTKLANDSERKMSALCVSLTGMSNRYIGTDGKEYFYLIGRENRDGAITGSVFLMANGFAYRKGTFRIESDGTIARKPLAFPLSKVSA